MARASLQAMVRCATFGSGALRSQCGSFFLPNHLGLQRIVAVRQLRIGCAHGCDQRLHHFGLDAVRQMARIGDVLEAAPAVGNLLVLGERVGDQRERPQVLLEGLGQRLGGAPCASCRRRPAAD